MGRLGYRPELDGLRGIAIGLVVAYHFTGWPRGGFIGVDLFFVLSGFLITTLLLEERQRTGRISLRGFYLRRFRRLAPALLILLAVYSGAALAFGEPMWMWDRMKAAGVGLFYVADWARASGPFANAELTHLWSLSVEEKFYLMWPLTLIFLLRGKERPAVLVGGLCVLVFVARWLGGHLGWGWDRLYFASEFRIDQLLIGCLLGLTWRALPKMRGIGWLGLAGVGAFALTLSTSVGDPLFFSASFTLVGLCAAAAVLGALHSERLKALLSFPPLVWLGLLSYSLYLWHQPIRAVFGNNLLGLGLSLAAASASFYLVERRFVRRLVQPVQRSDRAGDEVTRSECEGDRGDGRGAAPEPGILLREQVA